MSYSYRLISLFARCLIIVYPLLLTIGVAGHPFIQSRGTTRPPARKAPSRPSYNSEVGVSYSALTPDGDGGVWIGGQIFEEALLLNLGRYVKGHSAPGISRVDDIFFATREHGWSITRGMLYATKDGGRRWDRIDIGHDKRFTAVYFVDERVGWAVGQAGAVFHTADGGETWQRQDSGTSYDLTQIQFANQRDGWALAVNPQAKFQERMLLSTHDGGDDWEPASLSKSPALSVFSFVNVYNGWALDLDDNVLNTIDGGRSWNLKRPAGDDSWQGVYFINEFEGWVVGDGILHTKDGGDTWEYQVPSADRNAGHFIDKVYFADRKHGWAVGFFHALTTKDGGVTWAPIPDRWKQPLLDKILKRVAEKN
jgi:photosystem II stability/assembly factor-like uncharacterized protein